MRKPNCSLIPSPQFDHRPRGGLHEHDTHILITLVADGANDEAALLKQEIEEGLNWVELSWADLEFANDPNQ